MFGWLDPQQSLSLNTSRRPGCSRRTRARVHRRRAAGPGRKRAGERDTQHRVPRSGVSVRGSALTMTGFTIEVGTAILGRSTRRVGFSAAAEHLLDVIGRQRARPRGQGVCHGNAKHASVSNQPIEAGEASQSTRRAGMQLSPVQLLVLPPSQRSFVFKQNSPIARQPPNTRPNSPSPEGTRPRRQRVRERDAQHATSSRSALMCHAVTERRAHSDIWRALDASVARRVASSSRRRASAKSV